MSEPRHPHLRVVSSAEEGAPLPRVWLLLGERQGDNAQVLALGRALTRDLGWVHEIKQLQYDPDCEIPYKNRGATLTGIDLARSDSLAPPWPDVVIGLGRRAAPVSRWLKAQTEGRLLNVHLGRPRMAYHHFDLIVTTPQYGLPDAPNVAKLTLPITLNEDAALDAEAKSWEPKLRDLPHPWIAVFVGGPTSLLRFDHPVGAELLARAKTHVARRGTLLLTTSPRTSAEVADAFEAALDPPHRVYRWSADTPNPYRALLKLADEFIVTSDSVSMIAEAVDMMKPLYIYEVPRRGKPPGMGPLQRIRYYLRSRREDRLIAGLRPDLTDRVYDALTRIGRARPRRSVAVFDRQLYQAGLARPLGRAEAAASDRNWSRRRVPKEERDMVVARIREIFIARIAARAP